MKAMTFIQEQLWPLNGFEQGSNTLELVTKSFFYNMENEECFGGGKWTNQR